MAMAPTVQRLLSREAVRHQIISHPKTESLQQAAAAAEIAPVHVARAVVLRTNESWCMAVVPLSHILDFGALAGLLPDTPQFVSLEDLGAIFEDCEAGCIPPWGEEYGLKTIYDDALFECDPLVFEGGSRGSLVRIGQGDFRRLVRNAAHVGISKPATSLAQEARAGREIGDGAATVANFAPATDIKQRIARIYELPQMPTHAREILALRNNPNATAIDLAHLVELDPSLAAQIVRYSRSPLFGYCGKVQSLQDAISRVLGFEMAMNLAVALAVLKPFKNPPDGPLGLNAFWRHATLSAALAYRLAEELPATIRPSGAEMYLIGLLHNFGFLLFGHLFQPEFFLLNKMAAANPRIPVTILERQVLCMGQAKDMLYLGHAEVGAWLMNSWNIPEPVVVGAREHHNEQYRGPHALQANLILVADRLLKRHGIGDGCDAELPDALLQSLGLSEERAVAIAEDLLEGCADVDDLGGQGLA
jgi:HD-like signal output (HDOD) protein/prolyl-tRNA editing enzyme YbaK/EbsC (Cys-tRNA(Pro) deacylase)